MKKIIVIFALLLGVLNFLWHPSQAMAFSNVIWPGPMPEESIKIYVKDGSLTQINYFISSTGATSGIRYRTTFYYITLRDTAGNPIATFQFKPSLTAPPPGETLIDMYTVTSQDLLGAGFSESSLLISNFASISLSATIEIYNANTGNVLETFGDKSSVPTTIYPVIDQKAGSIGFGSKDIQDMKTRYASLDQFIPPPELPPPPPPPNIDEDISGHWTWYEYSGNYYERTWMTVTIPEPEVVKAGQGTSVIVTTYYKNNNPAAWNGSRYSNGIRGVTIDGPITDDWKGYKSFNTQATDDMVLVDTEIYYENYYEQTYQKTFWYVRMDGSISTWTEYFYIGYNVPVVKQTWIIPYARFDSNGWTRHQTPPSDIDNRYVFGGLNRWYFGFDIPDNQQFDLKFSSHGGVTGRLGNVITQQITIMGSPYDDLVVRTVDPRNPFPGGVSPEWQGFEAFITDLTDWYYESEIRYQRKLEQWRNQKPLQLLSNFFYKIFFSNS